MAQISNLKYTEHALSDLKKIDKKIALRIVVKIKENSELKNPLIRAKQLSGVFTNIYRYRIGDYRALFEINDKGSMNILIVLRVKYRKDAYKL